MIKENVDYDNNFEYVFLIPKKTWLHTMFLKQVDSLAPPKQNKTIKILCF